MKPAADIEEHRDFSERILAEVGEARGGGTAGGHRRLPSIRKSETIAAITPELPKIHSVTKPVDVPPTNVDRDHSQDGSSLNGFLTDVQQRNKASSPPGVLGSGGGEQRSGEGICNASEKSPKCRSLSAKNDGGMVVKDSSSGLAFETPQVGLAKKEAATHGGKGLTASTVTGSGDGGEDAVLTPEIWTGGGLQGRQPRMPTAATQSTYPTIAG